MEQKLIFLDIDGTLLPPGEMTVPARTKEALCRAQANGHRLFLCTGRNCRMTSPLLQLGIPFAGYVCSAGGYVCCGGKTLVDIPMDEQDVKGLCAVMQANGVECTLEAKEDTYGGAQMVERFAGHIRDVSLINSEAERWRKALEYGMTIRSLDEYRGEPIYKIVYIAPNTASLAPARAQYESRYVFCESLFAGSPDGIVNGELINRKFDKGRGIQAICRHLGCSMEDTIGFGDSDNDLQMAQTVGLSVCMANGSEHLKQISDRICPPAQEDGVAQELAALGLI